MLKKAFTLIELLVVIGVMAVIAAGVIATINPQQKMFQARDSQKQNGVAQLATALQAAAAVSATGLYPVNLSDLTTAAYSELTVLPQCPGGGTACWVYTGGGTNSVCVSAAMQATKNTTVGTLWCWCTTTGVGDLRNSCP